MSNCKLEKMFELRRSFIDEMRKAKPGSYPEKLPVDLLEKEGQRFCRDLALNGVDEMFEALQHLKNWKPHKETYHSIDRQEFLEEFVDALNYFFAMMIVAGFDEEELFKMYEHKDRVIRSRLYNGY